MTFEEIIQEAGRQITKRIYYKKDDVITYVDKEDIVEILPSFSATLLKTTMVGAEVQLNVALPDLEIYIEIEAKYGDDTAVKTLGPYFRKTEPTYNADKKTYTHTLYDFLLKTMVDYVAVEIDFPCTVYDFFNKVVETAGLVNNITSLANGNLVMESDIYDGIESTYRDVIDDILEANGTPAWISDNNVLNEIVLNSDENAVSIDDDLLYNTNVEFGEHFGPINSIVLSRSADADSVYLKDDESIEENGLTELKISGNQLMNDNNRSDFLPALLKKLKGIEYDVFDVELTGYGGFTPLQKVNFSTGDNAYSSYVFNCEIEMEDGYKEAIYTDLPDEAETDYSASSETDKLETQTTIIANKQTQQIQSLISSVSETSEKITEILQELDEITATVSGYYDFEETVEGTFPITLEDCLNTNILVLDIYVNSDFETVFSLLVQHYEDDAVTEATSYSVDTSSVDLYYTDDANDIVEIEYDSETGNSILKAKKYIELVDVAVDYEVEACEDYDYGFELGDDGYYESNNKAIASSTAMCKVSFNVEVEGTILSLDCINYAESNFDYGTIYSLDTLPSDGDVLKSFKGSSSSEVQEVEVSSYLSVGSHFIYIAYSKDLSVNKNNDSLKFKVNLNYKEKAVNSEPTEIVIAEDFPFELYEGTNKITAYPSTGKSAINLKASAIFLVNTELNKYFASNVELTTKIKQTLESIILTVNECLDGIDYGTIITQNKDSVQIAWNQIGQNIQLEADDDGNAILSIYDENDVLLMSLTKDGIKFYDSGNELGSMGLQAVDDGKFIAFELPLEYDENLPNGFAWGVTVKKLDDDGNETEEEEFIPIMYLSDYYMAKQSDTTTGMLHLANCNLKLDQSLYMGNLLLTVVDSIIGDMTFFNSTDMTQLLKISPANSDMGTYDTIEILDKMSFYKNSAGYNTFKIGDNSTYVLICDDGSVVCKTLTQTSDIQQKKNVERYEKSAVKEIMDTDICTFNYKNDKESDKKNVGAIIGSDYNCSDDIISEDGKHVNIYSMISLAYKAIQEQQEEIEALKEEIKKLKEKDKEG